MNYVEAFHSYLKDRLQVSGHTTSGYVSDITKAIEIGIISEDLSYVNMEKLFHMDASAATKHRMRAAIKKYARFLIYEKVIEAVPGIILDFDLPKIKSVIPKMTKPAEADKISEHCDDIKIKTAISILSSTGCRISSLVALQIEDIGDDHITFRTSKGDKPYVTFLNSSTRSLIWELVGSRKSGALFLNTKDEPYSSNAFRNKMKKVLGDSYVNPHSFRHGVATAMTERGIDVFTVKEHLNHTSIATTQHYIQLAPFHVQKEIKEKYPELLS